MDLARGGRGQRVEPSPQCLHLIPQRVRLHAVLVVLQLQLKLYTKNLVIRVAGQQHSPPCDVECVGRKPLHERNFCVTP